MSKQEQNLRVENDASQLSGLLCNYIVEGAKHLDNNMWTNRSLTLVKAFVPVAVALRDAQITDLTPTSINELLCIEKLVDIAFNHQGKFGEDFDKLCKPLANYIKSLSGFDAENPLNVSQKLIDQHGLFAMTLHRVVGELTTFGTATLKLDFLGKDLTALLVAYNDSLAKQDTLDNTLFLKAANDEDNLFIKQGAVEYEHDLFSVSKEESLFAKSDDPEEDMKNVLAEVVQFFAKPEGMQVEESLFDVTISKAS